MKNSVNLPMNPGMIVQRIEQQRNAATTSAAVAQAECAAAMAVIEAAFFALDQCIASGQIPHEKVPELVASVPGFAEWRAA